MKNKILEIYYRLIEKVQCRTHRSLFEEFNADRQMTGLIGARGTGKTTLMLQYIKEKISDKDEAVYASMDHIYFSKMRLYDFVEELHETEGRNIFFLDEIHKYENWNQELKNIYDSFPEVRIVFSGSSSLDIVKGNYDLSRRSHVYRLPGMSFREYYNFCTGSVLESYRFKDLIKNYKKISFSLSGEKKIKNFFSKYLEYGYYPFVFDDEETYSERLLNVINKTVYEDIANFYKLKTENTHNFKKILSFLATIRPGETNVNNISKNLGVDNKTILNYLNILEETGLLCRISINRKGNKLLRNAEKYYLNNSNIYKTIVDNIGYQVEVGTIREVFFINMLQNSGEKIYYSKKGDFEVMDLKFEIGGRSKSKKKIKDDLENSFIVKDDIMIAEEKVIPLYLFGFLY